MVGTPHEIEALKTGNGCWLTLKGINAVLRGCLPCHEDVVPDSRLWSDEPRIGLEREAGSRTAKESMLYSTWHVRPRRGVSLGVRIAGLPLGWTLPSGRLLTLGGESRLAECRAWEADVTFSPPLAEIEATGRAAVVALSSLDLPRDVYVGGEPLDALGNARVVSACLDRPQRIGGWDSLARQPLPLRSVLPPGSTLFCEIAEPERFAETVRRDGGLARIGSRQEWGFGLVALGVWPRRQKENR